MAAMAASLHDLIYTIRDSCGFGLQSNAELVSSTVPLRLTYEFLMLMQSFVLLAAGFKL